MYIRLSKDIQDVFGKSYARSIYVLCPKSHFINDTDWSFAHLLKTNIPTVNLQIWKWPKVFLEVDAPKKTPKFLKSNSEGVHLLVKLLLNVPPSISSLGTSIFKKHISVDASKTCFTIKFFLNFNILGWNNCKYYFRHEITESIEQCTALINAGTHECNVSISVIVAPALACLKQRTTRCTLQSLHTFWWKQNWHS